MVHGVENALNVRRSPLSIPPGLPVDGQVTDRLPRPTSGSGPIPAPHLRIERRQEPGAGCLEALIRAHRSPQRPFLAVARRPVPTSTPLRPVPRRLHSLDQCLDIRLPVLCIRLPRHAIPPAGRVLVQVAPALQTTRDVAGPHRGADIGAACPRSPWLLSPAGRLACVLPIRRCPAHVACTGSVRPVRPHVRGFPPLGVLCGRRRPSGIRRAFPLRRPVGRSTAPPRFRPRAVSGFPLPCRMRRLPAGDASAAPTPVGPPKCFGVSLPAGRGLWTPAHLRRLAQAEALGWPSVRVHTLGGRPKRIAPLAQHVRGRGHPDGLQEALSTRRPSCSPW